MAKEYRYDGYGYDQGEENGPLGGSRANASSGRPGGYDDTDVFGHEEGHDVGNPDELQ